MNNKLKKYVNQFFRKTRNLLYSKPFQQDRSVSHQYEKGSTIPHQQKEIINEVFNDMHEYAKHMGVERDVKQKLHVIKKEFIKEFKFIINDSSSRNRIESCNKYKIVKDIRKAIEHRIDRMDFTDKIVNTSFIFAIYTVVLLSYYYNFKVRAATNSVPGLFKFSETLQPIEIRNLTTISFLILITYFTEKLFNFISSFKYKSTVIGLKRCLLFLDKKYLE